MAIVAPFRPVRFNPGKIKHLEDIVTPPYDIIDEKNQASFQARNPYNMIHATFDGLRKEQSPRMVAARRGKKVADVVRRGDEAPAPEAAEA